MACLQTFTDVAHFSANGLCSRSCNV